MTKKRSRTGGQILNQCLSWKDDARDREIKAAAIERAKKYPRDFSRYVRGLKCPSCGSRRTITEFYRIPPDKKPAFGGLACDKCGAC